MKRNKMHLNAINTLLQAFQRVGLSLWKVSLTSSTPKPSKFSFFSLIFSIVITISVIYYTIEQCSKKLTGFDTLSDSFISTITRIIHRLAEYSYIIVIYIPVWVYWRDMQGIYDNFISIKRILKELNARISTVLLVNRAAIVITIAILIEIFLTFDRLFFGAKLVSSKSTEKSVGITWGTLFTYVIPPILKNMCILQLLVLTSLTSTRLFQLKKLLKRLI